MMKPETVAFLRRIDIGERNIEILSSEQAVTVSPEVLVAHLRRAWREGRYSARDHFTWHSPAELLGEPDA